MVSSASVLSLAQGGWANACAAIRMNRRKADFKFAYKFLEDDL